jgi:hypothetical protein
LSGPVAQPGLSVRLLTSMSRVQIPSGPSRMGDRMTLQKWAEMVALMKEIEQIEERLSDAERFEGESRRLKKARISIGEKLVGEAMEAVEQHS